MICEKPNCSREAHGRGLCRIHFDLDRYERTTGHNNSGAPANWHPAPESGWAKLDAADSANLRRRWYAAWTMRNRRFR